MDQRVIRLHQRPEGHQIAFRFDEMGRLVRQHEVWDRLAGLRRIEALLLLASTNLRALEPAEQTTQTQD